MYNTGSTTNSSISVPAFLLVLHFLEFVSSRCPDRTNKLLFLELFRCFVIIYYLILPDNTSYIVTVNTYINAYHNVVELFFDKSWKLHSFYEQRKQYAYLILAI